VLIVAYPAVTSSILLFLTRYLLFVWFLLDDIRFVVIGQKLAKDTAFQKALKVYPVSTKKEASSFLVITFVILF